MKKKPTYAQVPLSDDDKDMLKVIYVTRLKYAFITFLFMYAIVAYFSLTRLDYRGRYSDRITHWEENADSKFVSRNLMSIIGFSFLGIPITGLAVFYFRRKVFPFKKDIQNGMKDKVPYTIMRKEFFEYTSQYYFGFDDPNYLHHQVDAALFFGCQEGDVLYLYRAPLSGYTFEMNGRFTL